MLVAPVIAIPKPPSDAVAQQMCDEWGCRCVHAKIQAVLQLRFPPPWVHFR